eukprot:6476465-Amphidinium_carterae.2
MCQKWAKPKQRQRVPPPPNQANQPKATETKHAKPTRREKERKERKERKRTDHGTCPRTLNRRASSLILVCSVLKDVAQAC